MIDVYPLTDIGSMPQSLTLSVEQAISKFYFTIIFDSSNPLLEISDENINDTYTMDLLCAKFLKEQLKELVLTVEYRNNRAQKELFFRKISLLDLVSIPVSLRGEGSVRFETIYDTANKTRKITSVTVPVDLSLADARIPLRKDQTIVLTLDFLQPVSGVKHKLMVQGVQSPYVTNHIMKVETVNIEQSLTQKIVEIKDSLFVGVPNDFSTNSTFQELELTYGDGSTLTLDHNAIKYIHSSNNDAAFYYGNVSSPYGSLLMIPYHLIVDAVTLTINKDRNSSFMIYVINKHVLADIDPSIVTATNNMVYNQE